MVNYILKNTPFIFKNTLLRLRVLRPHVQSLYKKYMEILSNFAYHQEDDEYISELIENNFDNF